jgi:hypothetical protein
MARRVSDSGGWGLPTMDRLLRATLLELAVELRRASGRAMRERPGRGGRGNDGGLEGGGLCAAGMWEGGAGNASSRDMGDGEEKEREASRFLFR